jgi:hypothetical protein
VQREALLRRTGAVTNAGVWYGPGSAERHENAAPRPGHEVIRPEPNVARRRYPRDILLEPAIMKTLAAVLAIAAFAAVSTPADAKGCLKGAVVGGVAGHYAGHHGVLGAVAGCVYGRHHAKEQARQQNQAPNGQERM